MASIHATLAATLALFTAGCAISGSPAYDSQFGDAARALQAQQTYDPNAPQRNAGVVPGTDGRTMREAMDRQVGSFKEPPAATVINIGVGGK